jgi:hypothetical protein
MAIGSSLAQYCVLSRLQPSLYNEIVTIQYKLLVLDIDGTLIGKSGKVSHENKQALARASSRGVIISLCTGRSLNGSLPLLAEMSLDGSHIFCDGALVLKPSTGHEIYAQELEAGSIRKAVEWAQRHGMDIELYSSIASN